MKMLMVFIWIAALCITCLGDVIDPPKLTPKPSTEEESMLIAQGNKLHDEGKYDEAISKYEEVLKKNPDNALALYEMAFSYSLKKDYKKTLEVALKAAQYKSNYLADSYVLVANSYDSLGEADKAIKVYEKGIKLNPENPSLHFNLAVTYFHQNKPDNAKKSLKMAILLKSDYLSCHFGLSQVYSQTGYKVPALLSALRFLAGDPTSPRAEAELKLVKSVLQAGVKEGQNNQINVLLDPNEKTDEGDFGGISGAIAITAAGRFLEKNKDKTEAENLIDQIKVVFSILKETDKKQKNKGFASEYYLPYFIELETKGYTKAFSF